VILVGVYEAEALSTVAIGTQDKTVQTASVTIEPGETPIYLVIASYEAIIWRFSGALQRVEHVVLSAFASAAAEEGGQAVPLVGETGLPRDRVTFLGSPKCLQYFSEAPSVASAKAAAIVSAQSGKYAKVVAARYAVSGFSAPSGELRTLRETRRSAWPLIVVPGRGALRIEGDAGNLRLEEVPEGPDADVLRFNPGGLAEVDATAVVASLTAEPYVVLPQEAGLQQLVRQGALTRNREGELLIHRKIRFPAGLYGAHSVTFLLLRGVPKPDGDPGHSTVISEETGEPVDFGKR
jgi:hypothetical protein